jgi:predicted nucleic acid-binding protein
VKAVDDARFVADTDVISYIFRGDTRAETYQQAMAGGIILVSFMTVAELDRWSLAHNWGTGRKERLATLVANFALVLPDREMCRTWAGVVDGSRRVGRPISTADAWVAATAIAQDAMLVTTNADHFSAVDGLRLFRPNGRTTGR